MENMVKHLKEQINFNVQLKPEQVNVILRKIHHLLDKRAEVQHRDGWKIVVDVKKVLN